MSKNQDSEKKRRFPWKTIDPYPIPNVNYRSVGGIGGIYVDAQTGQWFFLLFAVPSLIVSIGVIICGKTSLVSVIFLVIGILCSLVSLYCFLSHREDLKIEAEKKAARDEKQRLWREKRRSERKNRKRR